MGVAELTAHFGLNHNGIRQHLAKLTEAGLIVEETHPTGRPGRPRLSYRIDPVVDGRWGTPGPYRHLSLALLEMMATDTSARQVGKKMGHDLGVRNHDARLDQAEMLERAIARGGFEPRMDRRGKRLEFVLANCPFAEAAALDPDTVCDLHLGLAEGLAEQIGGVGVDTLVRRSPHQAGCRLRFRIA